MVDRADAVPLGATVIRADEPTHLECRWGNDVLRWELAATDVGTRLTFPYPAEWDAR
jgi:hypothetical protein